MTNQEKALEAARVIKEEIGMSEHSIPRVGEIIDWCLTWKDQQYADIIKEESNTSYESGLAAGTRKAEARFKEYLEKKYDTALNAWDDWAAYDPQTAESWRIKTQYIREIINGLFNNE